MRKFPFQSLIDWSKTHGRHSLPWRRYFHFSTKDLGYRVWLSEILLQQTQVERVIGYYDDILRHFPTIESLAKTSYEEFFPHYQGLGYYSRARNMLKTAIIVTGQYGEIFPNSTEELIKFPGIGPYTATAIRAFAYDEPLLSFDTNLEKIFSRYYYGTRFHKLTKEEKIQIEKDFQATGISGREMNAAFMDFGSLVSLNNRNGIDWEDYPFKNCRFYETSGALEFKEPKKQRFFPTKDARLIVVLHRDHKVYYSSDTAEYIPFILPPTEGNIRHFVQSHFRDRYGLELSVRPIHDKYFENDSPFIVCNAQVQKGNPSFSEYRKENGFFVENTYTQTK